MNTIEIKQRFTGNVLYTYLTTDERQSSGLPMRDALEAAIKSGAILSGAILSDAILSDANLSGANLSGANLSGAKWRDGVTIQRAPLQLSGLHWMVFILDQHMQIGCELHTIEEWASFDDARIVQMDGKEALRFWRSHKSALLALAASDQRGVAVEVEIKAQQPDMRHPKIQALIGSNARKDIEMGLVEQLLEDPTCELTCMDMEYWNSTHDKLREKLLTQQPQPEPVGEVVIGEEGMTKGWTVIKWRADLPPIAVGTKLYAEPQASLKPLTREQIDVIWSAQGSFTDRESDYRCFARAIEQSHNIGVKP